MSIDLDKQLLARIILAAERGVKAAGEHVLEKAKEQTPVDTGDLRDSGRTRRNGTKVRISFTDPIAIIVHENQQAEHTRGNAKFLENAMNSEKDRAAQIVSDEIRKVLGG